MWVRAALAINAGASKIFSWREVVTARVFMVADADIFIKDFVCLSVNIRGKTFATTTGTTQFATASRVFTQNKTVICIKISGSSDISSDCV